MPQDTNAAESFRVRGERRQRSGAACEECRRRKLRCDGQQPQCGTCEDAGVLCEVNPERAVRGPKKGYLKALRNRVSQLESRLAEQQQQPRQQQQPQPDIPLTPSSHETRRAPSVSTPLEGLEFPIAAQNTSESYLSTTSAPTEDCDTSTEDQEASMSIRYTAPIVDWRATSMTVPSFVPTVSGVATELTSTTSVTSSRPGAHNDDTTLSETTRAELDQLYFDRVHASIPILHQRRYLSWSRSKSESKASRTCLQRAMWTLATMLSVQYENLQQPLYHEAKQMLESLSMDSNGGNGFDLELVQAWVLIATCESMKAYHHQAWMSAGRTFRLVQLMRLHELDTPMNAVLLETDFIETEMKRRVFWMSYFLDHLFSMRNNWPVTLNEHVICTRLPAPESEFQSGHMVLGNFLSEAVIQSPPQVLSPFNECVILATICGRSLFQTQQYDIRCAYGDVAPDWSAQRQWLDDILATRLQILSSYYPSATTAYDPMLLFANIMSQTTIVYLCKSMDSMVSSIQHPPEITLALESQNRALAAADKILELARVLQDFHFSKVHPLMPIPLFLTAEFLYTNRSTHENFHRRLKDLLDIFRQLKDVNNHKQSYIHLLELTCTLTSYIAEE